MSPIPPRPARRRRWHTTTATIGTAAVTGLLAACTPGAPTGTAAGVDCPDPGGSPSCAAELQAVVGDAASRTFPFNGCRAQLWYRPGASG